MEVFNNFGIPESWIQTLDPTDENVQRLIKEAQDMLAEWNAELMRSDQLRVKNNALEKQKLEALKNDEKKKKEFDEFVISMNAKLVERKKEWNELVKKLANAELNYCIKMRAHLEKTKKEWEKAEQEYMQKRDLEQAKMNQELADAHRKQWDQHEEDIVRMLEQFKMYSLYDM